MRNDIVFEVDSLQLRGWHYLPASSGGSYPTIVMAHGFSAVKEQYLDNYADAFALAGFGVIVFDNRSFGTSDGQPRQEIDPIQQCRDYRHAITYACTLQQVDPDRIGIWGTSYSGGHVLSVAAFDRRVKCVVSQVPTISGPESSLRRTRPDLVPGLLEALHADRSSRFAGEPPKLLPVVTELEGEPCALAGKEAWKFFIGSSDRAPKWRNEVTLQSAAMAREYEPGVSIHRISPTPLLMIVAEHDYITPTDLALSAFEKARQPKKLVLLKDGHFSPYVKQFRESSTAAIDWFTDHL